MSEPDLREPQPPSASPSPNELEKPAGRFKAGGLVLVFLLMLGVGLAIQWKAKAFTAELGNHADETAHYVTAMMFRDYIAGQHHGSIRDYIENYYAHYPRVAIGHWPPVFYGVLAGWWLFVKPSVPSAMALMAVIFALLATFTSIVVRRTSGAALAVLAGIALLSTRMSKVLIADTMADGLVALLVLAATLAFVKFLEGQRKALYSIAFGVLASLAILTKGSAVCLVFVPVIMIVLLRRWEVLLWPSLWLAPAIVVVMCGPWYWVTRGMFEGSWSPLPLTQYIRLSVIAYWQVLGFDVKWLGKILAGLGVLLILARLRDAKKADVTGVAMIALFVGVLAVACGVPTGIDRRLAYPAEAPLIFFMVYAADRIGQWIGSRKVALRPWQGTISVAIVVITMASYWVPVWKRFSGMSQPAELLIADGTLPYPSVLVVSDAIGEGVFISEMANRRFESESITIRGTKLLADVNWAGTSYKGLYDTPEELAAAIDATPVNFVLVDDSVGFTEKVIANTVVPHKALLDRAIAANPGNFQLLGTFPIERGRGPVSTVRLYRYVHHSNPPEELVIRRSRMGQLQLKVEVPETRRAFAP